jgi:RHS repeat-associated protein
MVLAEQAELTPDGERCTTWDYEPGTFTPLAQRTGTTLRDAPQDEIDRQFRSIITDLTGTPSEIIADDGTLAGRRQAVLWGGTAWQEGGDTTLLRFPGQYEDLETGLCQNGHRYYDSVTGSYLSPDPLGISPGPNSHRYVSNPHTLIDPCGLEPRCTGVQWITDKQFANPSFRYQKFVTMQSYEQKWENAGEKIHPDGGPTLEGNMVEAKWTGGEKNGEWAASQYNPSHVHYNESKILNQARKLTQLNEAAGGNGVRYAVSSSKGAAAFKALFNSKFPGEMASGSLEVWHVPANGMWYGK